MHRSVALVIPLYNEEEMFPILLEALNTFIAQNSIIKEVVLVNDGSKDKTEQVVLDLIQERPAFKLISFSRNFGHQIAVTAGLDYVEADAAVIMDADLQDPLDVVLQMIERWKEGYDVVYGVRKSRDGETWFKKHSAKWFYRFFRWITDLDIPLDTGDFRLVSRSVIGAYQQISEQQPFVRGLITWLGYNQIGIEYERKARAAGETKYPLKKMIRLAINGITSFSDKPLRIATQFGIWISIGSFFAIIWVLLTRFVFQTTVPGWASSLLVMLLLGGVQIFFLGIIGTYISRIHAEVRNRPRYLVKQVYSFSDGNSDE